MSNHEIDAFLRTREETSVIPVAVHGSYLINLASPGTDVRGRSLVLLLEEMTWAERLQIPYLVLHPGSHLGTGEDAGVLRVVEAVNRIHEKTRDFRVKILLETNLFQQAQMTNHNANNIDFLRQYQLIKNLKLVHIISFYLHISFIKFKY